QTIREKKKSKSEIKNNAVLFINIIKNQMLQENLKFDDVFLNQRYDKKSLDQVLLKKLNIDSYKKQEIFDDFFMFFFDKNDQMFDCEKFENFYNEIQQKVFDSLYQFLDNNYKQFIKKCKQVDKQEITSNQFLDILKELDYEEKINKYEIEYFCNQKYVFKDRKYIEFKKLIQTISKKYKKEKEKKKEDEKEKKREKTKSKELENNKNTKNKFIKNKKKKKIQKNIIENTTKIIIKDIENFMDQKNVGIRYIFKKFDKDNDEFISFQEFENSLQDFKFFPSLKEYSSSILNDIIESVFEEFDQDQEMRITLNNFIKIIQKDIPYKVDIIPLLNKLKSNIEGNSEQVLLTKFNEIDINKDQQLSFEEFKRYVKDLTKNKTNDQEIEALFNYFVQEKTDNFILFPRFQSVILQNHMNFEKIRAKILEYQEKNEKSLKTIYNQYSSNSSININSLS
ncbi:hypothetical protein IMG5_107100, partial [Ichthyophthirius multifiliis]